MIQEETKIKETIKEFNSQILELKTQVVSPSMTDSYDSLISELEKARDLIQEKYDTMQASGESNWTKLEKNIYSDVKSFNNAYKKAGALFKPRQK